jgi:hypothetical protein
VCKYEDGWYAANNKRTSVAGQYNQYTYEAVLATLTSEPVDRSITASVSTVSSGSSYWNRYHSTVHQVKDNIDIAKVEAYTYNVRYNNQSYPINSIGLYVN